MRFHDLHHLAFYHTHCINLTSSYNRIRKTTNHLSMLREWVAFIWAKALAHLCGEMGQKVSNEKIAKSVNQELNNRLIIIVMSGVPNRSTVARTSIEKPQINI